MTDVRRRRWNDSAGLLPWEATPDAPNPGAGPSLSPQDAPLRPVLYGPKGEPLTWRRTPFGFRPPTQEETP